MCADPPMAWIPQAERLVVFSKLQNGLYIVEHVSGTGELLLLDIPFFKGTDVPVERAAFMRARVQVSMVQTLAHMGAILLHVVENSDVFIV